MSAFLIFFSYFCSEHTISLHGFCFVKVFLKLLQLIQIDMADVDRGESPSRLEGKFSAAVACCILGFGSLICWNSMLTMGDYYYHLFPGKGTFFYKRR
ncbi:hypothetical protein ES288_D02G285600v1 [Gossypium darwinii]|nr:hypothetical protein ES288_D02G285600v1 [Gossypium darwinii]